MEEQNTNIDSFYIELIAKVLSEGATSEELKLLKEWFILSPEHLDYYREMSHARQISSVLKPLDCFSAEATWDKVSHKLKGEEHIRSGLSISYILKVAAFWTFGVIVGSLAIYFGMSGSSDQSIYSQVSINEIVTPLGSKSAITLPDGTQVWLNAGSKLRYAQNFNGKSRNVFLEGEAFFKVKTNPKKPFVVNTSEMSVKAYGTTFNVKAYPEEGTITTTLIEGSVKIEVNGNAPNKFEVSLKPKQKLTYNKKSFSGIVDSIEKGGREHNQDTSEGAVRRKNPATLVSSVENVSIYTSWKDDKWIIEREKLSSLIVKLERRFDVKFIFKDESLKNYNVSGTITKETLEQILDILKLTTPMTYQIKDGIVTLNLDRARVLRFSKEMH